MKIGIINTWSAPWVNKMTGGLIYAMIQLTANINATRKAEATQPFALLAPKRRAGMSEEHGYDPEAIDDCDFLIFSNAGVGVGEPAPLLDFIRQRVRVPFACQFHHERETKGLEETRSEIARNKLFRLALPIDEAIDEGAIWGNARRIVYPAFKDTINAPEQTMRPNKIVSTCRYTSSKRLLELARVAIALRIPIEMHGADVNWFYKKDIDAYRGEYLQTFGAYRREALPGILAGAKWHYNATSHKRGPRVRRIELATIDAVEAGCIPVIHREQKPDWVTRDMASLVDPDNLQRSDFLRSGATPRAFVAGFNKQYAGKSFRLVNAIKEICNES